MPWQKTPNVAMFKGADWSNLIQQAPNCTPQLAKRIALRNPAITFFFLCNEPMYLEPTGPNPARQFNPGDAVFFSGEPWFGSAPQCDSYQKNGVTTVYINPQSSSQFRGTACYVLADGSPAVDVVCIFAANYCTNQLPYLRANNNDPPTNQPFNPGIQAVLDDGSVKFLQDKGLTVLLTVGNGWSQVGWSEFQNEQDAANFASYLQTAVIQPHGLDGIDIDDEYSKGQPQTNSLAMVTTLMRQIMPGILITKALFQDMQYFGVPWQGSTLENNLNYGWEMTYGPEPSYRLPAYNTEAGMGKNQLSLGFWSNQAPSNPAADVQWLKDNGYPGMMMFAFESQPNVDLMGTLVDDWWGPGNWNVDPNCGA